MQITSSFSNAAATGAQASTNQSDYLTFLNMLTVQMQNQDPLNPMDASDFAVQLATFAGVEQQTFTNQLLNAMLGQGGLSDLGSWVGMEARVFGGAWYGGDAISLAPDPALGAETATLIVRDSTGAIVDSRPIDPVAQSYRWDGLDSSGTRLPDGTYTFEVESRQGDSILDTQPVAAYVPVLEARYQNGATMLVMPGGLMVDSASVTGLRRPTD
ncbi:MAG: flagellar hook assembly protein FlgD [Rhodobacter sp.]|nr:flagellar hook assembly protein FlgD [Paracoccaceae bacterium]MCB1408834.1 flagellar hook assembly protein FlgD [Paracoccaceae bacterium]MCC0078378.1 flagellar hook assembly protein FlgD [Rhodobacter sp.]